MSKFNWYMPQDKLSVHVGINHRIGLFRKQKMVPTLIRLGREHTRLLLKEAGMHYIPNKKPRHIIHQGLFWDDTNNRLCYSKRMIPIRFNDPKIHGIVVEGRPRSPHSSS